MTTHHVTPAAALVVSVLVSLVSLAPARPAAAATVTDSWPAVVGTGGDNGTATVRAFGTSGGSLVLKLRRLARSSTYAVSVYRGTCRERGTRLLSLPAIRTTSTGTAIRTITLTAPQIATVAKFLRTTRAAVVIGSGAAARCGTFLKSTTARPQLWFQPLPPWVNAPPGGSIDFTDLFRRDAPWRTAAGHVQVIEFCVFCFEDDDPLSLAQLRQVYADLERRGIAVAIYAGALPVTDCGVGWMEGTAPDDFGLQAFERIRAAGGIVSFVDLAQPFRAGSLDPNGCRWSADRVAREVAAYERAVRKVFPEVRFGSTDCLCGNDDPALYAAWFAAYRAATGRELSYFHEDVDYDRPDWPAAALRLESAARARGIPFGLLYHGGSSQTDASWVALAEERFVTYESVWGGQPDHSGLFSWFDRPDYVLPETASDTFTHLLLLYRRTRTSLHLEASRPDPTGALVVGGRLLDISGRTLSGKPVTLTVAGRYEVSALPATTMRSDVTTDANGAFNLEIAGLAAVGQTVSASYSGDGALWPDEAQVNIGRTLVNLARGRPLSASRSPATETIGHTVDGNWETFWNSGDFPPQWIEIDLGAPMDILQVRLAIAQHPEGTTVHRILGRTDGEANRLLHEFAGLSKDGQVLDYAPLAPVSAVRYLRIETISSVSWVAWREIEVFGTSP